MRTPGLGLEGCRLSDVGTNILWEDERLNNKLVLETYADTIWAMGAVLGMQSRLCAIFVVTIVLAHFAGLLIDKWISIDTTGRDRRTDDNVVAAAVVGAFARKIISKDRE